MGTAGSEAVQIVCLCVDGEPLVLAVRSTGPVKETTQMTTDTRRQFLEYIATVGPGLWAAFAQWRTLAAAETATPAMPQTPEWLPELCKAKEWQELDALWDEMSKHGGPNLRWPRDAEEQKVWRTKGKLFEALKQNLTETLDAIAKRMAKLGASDGSEHTLRVLCMKRHYHIWRSRYLMATCYKPSYIGHLTSRSCTDLEKQLAALEQLRAQGKLTPEATAKAAQLIAQRAEILAQADAMKGRYDREKLNALRQKIDQQTSALKPDVQVSQQAADCGRMVVELTRD